MLFFNRLMALILRSPLHRLLSGNTMLITVRGRSSGVPVTTPVNYWKEGDDLKVTSLRSRQWWRNLRANGHVGLVLKGRRIAGQAELIEAEAEVARGLQPHLAQERALRWAKQRVLVRIRPDAGDGPA